MYVHTHTHTHTHTQVNKLVRCLTLLKEYVMECDEEYSEERGIPPHGKYVRNSLEQCFRSFSRVSYSLVILSIPRYSYSRYSLLILSIPRYSLVFLGIS